MIIKFTKEAQEKMKEVEKFILDCGFEMYSEMAYYTDTLQIIGRKDECVLSAYWDVHITIPNRMLEVESKEG